MTQPACSICGALCFITYSHGESRCGDHVISFARLDRVERGQVSLDELHDGEEVA